MSSVRPTYVYASPTKKQEDRLRKTEEEHRYRDRVICILVPFNGITHRRVTGGTGTGHESMAKIPSAICRMTSDILDVPTRAIIVLDIQSLGVQA